VCSQPNIAKQNILSNKKVLLNIDNLSVNQALKQLSHQTNFYFTYDANLIDGNKKITVKIGKVSLQTALDTILQTSGLNYQIISNQLIIYKTDLSDNSTKNKNRYKTISGKIIDKLTGKSLPYASISIKNKNIGVISNINGLYTIKIPAKYKNDTLIISYLGYAYKTYGINNIKGNLNVVLTPVNRTLQEITVSGNSCKDLIKKAISDFSKNYFSNAYSFEAFYRESVKKDKKIMVYSEALLSGYKSKISSHNEKAELIKGRTFRNLIETDTLLIKLKGGIDACFLLDIVREPLDFLTKENIDNYDYFLDGVTIWNNNLVYEIKFKPAQQHYTGFSGKLFLSVSELAIVEAEFEFSDKKIHESENIFVLRKSKKIRVIPQKTHYTVKYDKQNGKFFNKYVRGELTISVKKRRKFFKDNYTTTMEMLYTAIDTVNVAKPSKKKLIKTSTVFADANYLYDNKYWGSSNIINPDADIIEVLKEYGFVVNTRK
jgi:hypothetical protein